MATFAATGAACGDDDNDDDDDGDDNGDRPDAGANPDAGADPDPDAGADPDAGPEPDAAPPGPARIWVHGELFEDLSDLVAGFEVGSPPPTTPAIVLPAEKDARLSSFDSAASGAYDVSADGNVVVLPADIEVQDRFDLYAVRPDGSNLIRLVEVGAEADVAKARLSPNGRLVAFTADLEADNVFGLYVVRTNAPDATPTLVSPASATRDVNIVRWSSDSRSIFFTGDFTEANFFELYTVDVTTAAPTPVQLIDRASILGTPGPLGPAGAVEPLTDVGDRLLFKGRMVADNSARLYLIDRDGSGSEGVVPLSELTRTDGSGTIANVGAVGISPDRTRVAFAADQAPGVADLWFMPVDGSAAPLQITTGLVPPASGIIQPPSQVLKWSPDGQAVAVFADYTRQGKTEPFVAPIDQSGQRQVANIGGEARRLGDTRAIAWTPDGSQLYIIADHRARGVFELFALEDPAGPNPEPVLILMLSGMLDLRNEIRVSGQ